MSKEKHEVALEFKPETDLLAVNVQCPRCSNKYVFGTPYISVPCRKCGITFRTEFTQDIYTKKARQLLTMVAFNDRITIKAHDKYESSMMTVRQHFIQMNCR